jgi:hypothetical protein
VWWERAKYPTNIRKDELILKGFPWAWRIYELVQKGWATPMLTDRKLREKQRAMRARQPNKPWTFTNDENAERSVARMRVMLKAGMTDEFIGDAFDLSPVLVSILRSKR